MGPWLVKAVTDSNVTRLILFRPGNTYARLLYRSLCLSWSTCSLSDEVLNFVHSAGSCKLHKVVGMGDDRGAADKLALCRFRLTSKADVLLLST